MDEKLFNAFLSRAKDLWKRMERYRLAYTVSSTSASRKADVLKWLTLFSGIITGISSLTILIGESGSTILTGVAGVITGTLSLSDKLFRWEESSNITWEKSKALENLQSELYQFTVDVSVSDPSEEPGFFLQRMNEKINQETSLKVKMLDKYELHSKEALEAHGISSVTFASRPEFVEPEDEGLPDDAEGIAIVGRGAGTGG
jgi:hypothetical protein